MRPSFGLPPEEFCLGVSPRKAANSRGPAKLDAFPAWPWGGTGLHAIGNAGAVRGRSTGGRSGHSEPHCARHRLRSGHRNTRKESADIATRHSPSAAERAPRPPCCTRGNSSSSSKAIAICAGGSRALVRRQTKSTSEAYALLVLECSRNKSLLYQPQESPRSAGG